MGPTPLARLEPLRSGERDTRNREKPPSSPKPKRVLAAEEVPRDIPEFAEDETNHKLDEQA